MKSTMTGSDSQAGIREWIGLAVLVLACLIVSIDVFVLVLALPYLSADLGVSSIEQLWIMDIYGFMLSGFLITMGTLGDRIGRRKLLLLGAAAFGLASILAAFSTSPEMLIAARALLGIAGATLAPSTLALISNMFNDPRQRGLAISIWMAGFMCGAAFGPLIGGVMLENLWWGSVFLLGIPAMILLLVLGPVLLPEYRDTNAGRLDLVSVILSLGAILPIVYGFKELAKNGLHPLNIFVIVAGLAVGVIFVRRQHALHDPLLDLRLFINRELSTAMGGQLFCTMLMGVIMVLVTQYLQLVEGLTPLRASLWMIPAVAAQMTSFLLSPLLARRIRPAYLIGAGLAVSVTGLFLLTQVDMSTGITTLVIGYALTNFGSGPLMTLSPDLIVGSAPPEKAGSAGAMSQTSSELGFALGLAALGSIGTSVYRNQIADGIPAGTPTESVHAASDTLVGAAKTAQNLPSEIGMQLLASAREAFASGMNTVATISAILLIGVAVFAVTLLRHIRPSGETQQEQVDSIPAPVTDTEN
ncbi:MULTISPECIES: MFS transporter [Bacillus]|uniref:MFS transporter n=2 Tax=Bacillus TaxID=1386 RepID=A0A0M3RAE4_9BACI|nr:MULTISPECIES: MFS transporter [Bacillus]ALC83042.1 MFS transporter [Bacillus gobiensis]MBP1082077.1 DHA2 family multidrug resistance protein-like MFS transporter [Bacillus capparidis]MED1096702.1 MFS transporter [Bacillus capparidis]